MHYTKVHYNSSSLSLSQLQWDLEKKKRKEEGRGRVFGDFFMIAVSLSREQRSWMVSQYYIGEHIHCRQKHRKCGGLEGTADHSVTFISLK